ncbi:GDSL esterase/lipase At5g37690 isoform X1 [Herrania umbratica]|uniref:GDSL esterase/lipase At5g37690 isoform X1 n=1 Tax=Herrania umbratica TaxID=108875 RepID=A0A6J1BAL4_9ROSI|nr:GDSL esterase/lipase At5g37690 isoform X1 [Herrania umbratica]XP_021296506.1 GDSL esterase/lipase At5g37690 isoform X1 [Herrania umbratica]XP_021296507.1 GDSL esterase/lipase At5g37690 isoform X1 [Herrania umbratica]XP_021296508.1 GDSL esterase/lipase At5g37690 isoform X1 [Herrania umbratica]
MFKLGEMGMTKKLTDCLQACYKSMPQSASPLTLKRSKMAKRWLVFAATIVLVLGTLASAATTSSVTFVFGDSLAEVGNNNHLQYSLARSDYPWYGIDYTGKQATGRFTNGRTIGDIISEKLGSSSPPPYLSLLQNDDAILNGVNYASGGAGILNDTGLYFIQRLTFDDQINYFKKTKEIIRAKKGEEAANKLCNEAMYFIGIGSNDYVNNYLQPFLPAGQQYTHDEFVELLTTTLEQQLLRLYQLGARKVLYHGLGPLGCIPSQRVKSQTGQCLKRVNEWVMEFNSQVQYLINSLNRRLPNAQMIFADTYPAVLDLINNPSTYGFKISNTSCCNVDTSIGGLCLPNSRLCNERKDYVFWDAFHPSDAANEVLAEKLLSSLASASAPTPALAPKPH